MNKTVSKGMIILLAAMMGMSTAAAAAESMPEEMPAEQVPQIETEMPEIQEEDFLPEVIIENEKAEPAAEEIPEIAKAVEAAAAAKPENEIMPEIVEAKEAAVEEVTEAAIEAEPQIEIVTEAAEEAEPLIEIVTEAAEEAEPQIEIIPEVVEVEESAVAEMTEIAEVTEPEMEFVLEVAEVAEPEEVSEVAEVAAVVSPKAEIAPEVAAPVQQSADDDMEVFAAPAPVEKKEVTVKKTEEVAARTEKAAAKSTKKAVTVEKTSGKNTSKENVKKTTAQATVKNGFSKKDGKWKFYKDGKLQKNVTGIVKGKIDGKVGWYYIKNGVFTRKTLVSKRADSNNGNYYFAKDGVLQKITGKKTVSGKTYYFEKGVAATGLKTIGKSFYYFDKKGVMFTGWKKLSGNTYYFRKSGKAQTGVKVLKEHKTKIQKRYIFGLDGILQEASPYYYNPEIQKTDYMPNLIVPKVYEAYYERGIFVVKTHLLNGFEDDRRIHSISELLVTDKGKTIAKGKFNILTGLIPSNGFINWTFNFNSGDFDPNHTSLKDLLMQVK